MRYEGKEGNDDDTEDIMTLRTMLNLQRAYDLEMKREVGFKHENGMVYMKVPNGKTLKDGLDSYFSTMNKDKAQHIKNAVNIEAFYNSYKGGEKKEAFIIEQKRRTA